MTNGIIQHIIVEESTSIQWIEIIDKHQQSHKAIKPSFVNYYTFYLYVNFCQRSDKWFLVKYDNLDSADLPEVTSAAGYCKCTSPGPCISDYGQVIKYLMLVVYWLCTFP